MLRLLAIAALCCLAAHAAAQGESSQEALQRKFLEGAQLLQSGDFAGAESVFRALLEQSKSPRVKLELARVLYYRKQYRESRALFKEVLLEPELPWRVRENVLAFVNAIDDIIGYVRPSISLFVDSNPLNITNQRDFTIGGIRLTFEPPTDSQKTPGLRFAVQAYQPFLQEPLVAGYLTGSYLDYPNNSLDRLTVDAGLMTGLGASGDTQARAGIEAGTFSGQRLYHFPYVGFGQRLSQSPTHRVDASVKLGQVTFPDFSYLDAHYAGVTLGGAHVLSDTLAGNLKLTLEKSDAREAPYSYNGVLLDPGVSFLLLSPAVLFRANAWLAERRYAEPDPLFGIRRVDHKTALEFSVRGKEWRWMNSTPALVLYVEDNRSNISFYTYRKTSLSVVIE